MQVWDLHQLQCVQTLSGHTKAVLHLQRQGDYLFSVGGPSIRVWDVRTGKCVARLLTSRQAGWIRAISVTPHLEMVVGCQDTTLKIYVCAEEDLKGCELVCDSSLSNGQTTPSAGAQDAGRGSAVQPPQAAAAATPCDGYDEYDEPQVAVEEVPVPSGGTAAGGLVTFEVRADQRNVTVPALQGKLHDGHCAAIQAVVCSQQYVCTAGGDCAIRVWDRATLNPESTMIGHRGPVFALVLLGASPCPPMLPDSQVKHVPLCFSPHFAVVQKHALQQGL